MFALGPEQDARFLFRSDQGQIDVKTWRRGAALLGGLFLVLTAIWLALEPFTHRDLADTPFFAWRTMIAFVYLVFYAFAVLLIAISYYNLSAKRWRDRGRPAALAGILPFAALLAGAVNWFQPRVAEVMPFWPVVGFDLLLAGVFVWNVVELGTGGPPAA